MKGGIVQVRARLELMPAMVNREVGLDVAFPETA
jgi:hypothetical protein